MAETEVNSIIEIEASIPIKTGLNAKKYGMINAEHPNWQETNAILKGLAFARPEAAQAASATGGVIDESIAE